MLDRIHQKITDRFSVSSQLTITTISTLFLLLFGWLDYFTGDYSLIIFYLIPVSLMAWFVSRTSGVLFCFLSMTMRILTDYESKAFLTNYSRLHYWNLFIEFFFLIIMTLLFAALKKNVETEKRHASLDPLTGALNRRSFFDLADYVLSRSRRYGTVFTIAYMDLDNFKEINDSMGHHTGDKLLVTTVTAIKSHIRKTDIVARFGGDEFVILLPETNTDYSLALLEKLHGVLQKSMNDNNWPVTFSIGAITYSNTPASVDEIIATADTLMYDVKRAGKNRLLHTVIPKNDIEDYSEKLHGKRKL